jgi:hypothetical protein
MPIAQHPGCRAVVAFEGNRSTRIDVSTVLRPSIDRLPEDLVGALTPR